MKKLLKLLINKEFGDRRADFFNARTYFYNNEKERD